MTAKKQTGEPLVRGTISAEDQSAELHGAAPADRRLTPMQAAKLARDEFPGEGPEGFKQVTIAAENVPSLFGVQTAKKQTGAPHDETQPHDAWEKIDAAQDGKRATEQVVNTFKRVQASAARLVEHEEELEAAGQQRRNDADGEALASEISEARQQLAEAKRRAGISP